MRYWLIICLLVFSGPVLAETKLERCLRTKSSEISKIYAERENTTKAVNDELSQMLKSGKIKDSLRGEAIKSAQEFIRVIGNASDTQIRLICNDF